MHLYYCLLYTSKAVYKDDVDSIILASSDSDFWSVIEDVDANYFVLI